MSLIIYNYNATFFMDFWTRTYSPHKIPSIVIFGKVPSLSAYSEAFFLSFLKNNNIYGYLVTLLPRRNYTIAISLPVLRLPFYVTHFNIYYTSPTHHLCTCKLPSKTFSQQMTYLHMFNHTNILRLCCTLP